MAKATETNHPAQESFRKLQRQEIKGQVYEALSKDKELIEKDPFLARQEDYQLKFDVSADKLEKIYEELKKHYKQETFTEQELPSLLQTMYKAGEEGMIQIEAQTEIIALQQAIEDFDASRKVLREMDIRKQEIAKEVDQHVDNINAHRAKAKMDEYRPERATAEVRPLRKVEDYLRRK